MKNKKMLLFALLAAIIISCGGGGGGTSSPTPSVPSNPNNPWNPGTGGNSGGNNTGNNGSSNNPNNPGNSSNTNNPNSSFRPGVVKIDRQRLRIPVSFDRLNPIPVFTNRERVVRVNIVSNEEKRIGVLINSEVSESDPAHRSNIIENIAMNGKNSIAAYAYKSSINENNERAVINIAEESIGIYLRASKPELFENVGYPLTPRGALKSKQFLIYKGKININGSNSIGAYYEVEKYDHTTLPSYNELSTSVAPDTGFGFGFYENVGTIESSQGTVNVVGAYLKVDNGFRKMFTNTGVINIKGDKSIGMYATGEGEYAVHNYKFLSGNKIAVAASADRRNPNIAMYTDSEKVSLHNGDPDDRNYYTGNIEVGANSVGMYKLKGTGNGTPQVINHVGGKIFLKGDNAIGMILGENVYGINRGSIIVGPESHSYDNPIKGVIGVVLGKNSVFENRGTIDISLSPGSIAVLNGGGTFRNYGTVNIASQLGNPTPPVMEKIVDPITSEMLMKNMSVRLIPESPKLYVDTLGGTNPINGISSSGIEKVNLVMGTEAASKTSNIEIKVDKNILSKYNESFKGGNITEVDVKSDALTWETESATSGNEVKSVTLKKKSYTEFTEDEETKKLAAGLDARYIMSSPDSKEKELFNYINTLGNSQREILSKTYREVSGSQYVNVQQRIKETGTMLDREIGDIQKELADGSKIKTFATKGKYSSKIEEVPDHKATGYGAVYAYNNGNKKMGWYAAAGVNSFKLKDSGRTNEEVSMLKLGLYKTFGIGFGLNWKVTGEGFVSRSEMERKYVVGGVQYTGQAGYNAYGGAVNNEIGRNINLTDTFTLRPYIGLRVEYGKFNNIKEKNGVLKLEVRDNDYYSIRPETGIEMSYVQVTGGNTKIRATMGIGYDYETGKVENKENKLRFIGTGADWYKLKGEKKGERGNFKGNASLGFEKGHYSLSLTGGYETRGKNARIGLGIGASF